MDSEEEGGGGGGSMRWRQELNFQQPDCVQQRRLLHSTAFRHWRALSFGPLAQSKQIKKHKLPCTHAERSVLATTGIKAFCASTGPPTRRCSEHKRPHVSVCMQSCLTGNIPHMAALTDPQPPTPPPPPAANRRVGRLSAADNT